MSEKIWSDDAWEDYLYRENTADASARKTALFITWKMAGFISHIAVDIMEINEKATDQI